MPWDVVDTSEWKRYGEEHLGTKPKVWKLEPETELRWLLKYATQNETSEGRAYPKGDDWAECAVAIIADQLEVPTANVCLAVDNGERGVISQNVLGAGESLIHGNELFADLGVQVERNTRHGYTLEAVRSALDGAAGTLETPPEFSAWDCFVGYVVLDAIVANTDRHIENWAVINAGERRIAPSFDHASSLGFALFDGDRLDRLTSADPNFRVSGWTERARSRFQGKPHPRAVASQALDMVNPRVKRHWIERVDALGDPLNLWEPLPLARFSEPSREFAASVLRSNVDALLS